MKKSLMATVFSGMVILSTSPALADLRFNPATSRFYTTSTANNIDQEKYHNLVSALLVLSLNLEQEVSWLRIIGTPEALCLIEDMAILSAAAAKDVRRINQV